MNFEIHAAPMAGYTDHAFRRVLASFGARVLYTEMVSSTALFYKSKKTLPLLQMDKMAGVTNVVQLFGNNPEHFVFAVKSGLLDGFDEININMGCPAKKIIKNSEGAALMKNPELARAIIHACVSATDKPVSVKMRLGFDKPNDTSGRLPTEALRLAKICEDEGVSKIIVHGRYAAQGYSGVADWATIAEVVRSTNLPVIANGDVVDVESARRCMEATGARGVMVGRAMLGAPWVISFSKPKNIIETILHHLNMAEELGTPFGEMKKHLLFYAGHLPDSKELKLKIVKLIDFNEARQLF